MGDNSSLHWEKESSKKEEIEKPRSLRYFIFSPPYIVKGTGIIGVIVGLILLIGGIFLEGGTKTGTYLLVILFGVILFSFGVLFKYIYYKVFHWLKNNKS